MQFTPLFIKKNQHLAFYKKKMRRIKVYLHLNNIIESNIQLR